MWRRDQIAKLITVKVIYTTMWSRWVISIMKFQKIVFFTFIPLKRHFLCWWVQDNLIKLCIKTRNSTSGVKWSDMMIFHSSSSSSSSSSLSSSMEYCSSDSCSYIWNSPSLASATPKSPYNPGSLVGKLSNKPRRYVLELFSVSRS